MSDSTKSDQLPAAPDVAEKRPISSENVSEKGITVENNVAVDVFESTDEDTEPEPHLHAKTFLAVFAVCLIYFAQDFALVGAGAVS